jgi:hypothetical protein
MNTLMIKDLSITEQLDSNAMSAVRGGNGYGAPSSSYFNFMRLSRASRPRATRT